MSDKKKKDTTPPSSGSGATPAVCATAPCPLASKCCCCVSSIAIQNVRSVGNTPQFIAGTWIANGHAFDLVIQMTFAAGSSGSSNCSFQWWERVNIPAISGHPPNSWTDMFALVPTSPTFDPWNNRIIPCPGGGNLTVTVVDIPSLGSAPGVTQTRTLEFRLVVKSGAGCACGFATSTATATEVLQMVNGTLVAAGTSFVIGPSSTTP